MSHPLTYLSIMPFRSLVVELNVAILGVLDLHALPRLPPARRPRPRPVADPRHRAGASPSSRAKLLNLVLDLHKYQSFLASRPYILDQLRPFSRTSYVRSLEEALATLEGATRALPEDFKTWILEWPEKSVIGWAWPGLHNEFDDDVCPRNSKVLNPFERGKEHWWRTYGRNMLASPDGDQNPMESGQVIQEGMARLLVQDHGFGLLTFLVLDTGSPYDGQVWCEGLSEDGAVVSAATPCWCSSELTCLQVVPDWIAWLRRELDLIEKNYAPGQKARGQISEADILL